MLPTMAPPAPRQSAKKQSQKHELHEGPAPNAWLLALEFRAFWEPIIKAAAIKAE